MASLETIGPLMNGMRKRADTVGLACEAINRMFQKEQTELVAQVSDSEQFQGGRRAVREASGRCGCCFIFHTHRKKAHQLPSLFFLHSLLASL